MGVEVFCPANVYLPYDDHRVDSIIKYQNVLGELQGWLDDLRNGKVSYAGDSNADASKGSFWQGLTD